MNNNIDHFLMYEELNFNPIWKERTHYQESSNIICFYQEFLLNNNKTIFIAETSEENIEIKEKLFVSINNYLNIIADDKTLKYKKLNTSDLISSFNKIDFILLLTQSERILKSKFFNESNIQCVIKCKTSLEDIIMNTNNKKILWNDIKALVMKTKLINSEK